MSDKPNRQQILDADGPQLDVWAAEGLNWRPYLDIAAAMGLLRGFDDWAIDADGDAGRVVVVNKNARHEYDDFEAGFNPREPDTLPPAITRACLLAWIGDET